jgi:hypothetical protein
MANQAATTHQDISGYTVFSTGDAGAAHVMAHQMLDDNEIELGHQLLGEFLENHSDSGSDWIHLHFHMAIFELAIGDWDASYTRFINEILPAATTTQEALTDAPALLWRLALTAPDAIELPWEALRKSAIVSMQRPSEPFVELHNLLALAGAGDLANMDRWLESRPAYDLSRRERLVVQMAVALRAFVNGSYEYAAITMQRTVPQLPEVGGSRGQNQLFQQLEQMSWDRVSDLAFDPRRAWVA